MTKYIRSAIVKEMFESGVFDIHNGEFLIWDMPTILYPLNSILLINLMKEKHPEITMGELNYQIGKMQSHRGNKVLTQRYGFKVDEKFMKDTFGKSELLGMGIFEFLDFDIDTKTFTVINPYNPYAHQYLKVFGIQKESVCHYLRGLCAGSFQAFFEDEEMLCVELSCIAKGDKTCVFRIKPVSKWDKENPVVKEQMIKNKLPNEVFEKYYSWDSLISRNAGRPKDERDMGAIDQKIS